MKYLPSVALPDNLAVTADISVVQSANIIVMAMPTQHTSQMLLSLKPYLKANASIIIASKGILMEDTVNTPHLAKWLSLHHSPEHIYVLSGPNFAKEMASDLPAAATLAGLNEDSTLDLVHTLRSPHYRIYPSSDVMGVSLCGAIKNVYAIAAGICEGLQLGQNAKAALITRALAETRRLGMTMGADMNTFLGLSGVGDLLLSCSSTLSRNMSLGVELAQGKTLDEILLSRHTIAEGVYTAQALMPLMEHHKVRMPIAMGVHKVVTQRKDVASVIDGLLSSASVFFESE
jgi:glycerol-3-phosphate dehydrogenase (NAD(P)+)